MPRYFFHLFNSESVHDRVGEVHDNLDAAEISARNSIAELIAEQIVRGDLVDPAHRIDILDESGKTLVSRRFGQFILGCDQK